MLWATTTMPRLERLHELALKRFGCLDFQSMGNQTDEITLP